MLSTRSLLLWALLLLAHSSTDADVSHDESVTADATQEAERPVESETRNVNAAVADVDVGTAVLEAVGGVPRSGQATDLGEPEPTEDIGDNAVSPGQTRSIISGDPDVLLQEDSGANLCLIVPSCRHNCHFMRGRQWALPL